MYIYCHPFSRYQVIAGQQYHYFYEGVNRRKTRKRFRRNISVDKEWEDIGSEIKIILWLEWMSMDIIDMNKV